MSVVAGWAVSIGRLRLDVALQQEREHVLALDCLFVAGTGPLACSQAVLSTHRPLPKRRTALSPYH